MGTFKGTKGGWVQDGEHVLSTDGNVIASVFDNSTNSVSEMNMDEAIANSKLIACAPELLEALKTCADGIRYYAGDDNVVYKNALELIKKATE